MAEDVLKELGANPTRKEILVKWDPENEAFWKKFGEPIAKQNLYVSTWALTLSFVVWTLWATIAAQLNQTGFNFTDAQIFTLASLPGLVGATCRLFYTYMPGILGGKLDIIFDSIVVIVDKSDWAAHCRIQALHMTHFSCWLRLSVLRAEIFRLRWRT